MKNKKSAAEQSLENDENQETDPTRGRNRARKDHVLQARVPESLYRDLVGQARRLRVPVSNLVRNILEDSLRVVENIVDGSLDIAEALAPKVEQETLEAVLGWQSMSANRSLVCARCGKAIPKDSEAFAGVGAPAGKTIVICEVCKCAL